MWYVYTMEYYSDMRKDILPFTTTWMNLEHLMLKWDVRETQVLYDITYMESKNDKLKNRGLNDGDQGLHGMWE